MQKRISEGEANLAEQVSKVEEVVAEGFRALGARDEERRKDLVKLEEALQDKMEARKGEDLEAVRLKCLKRCGGRCARVVPGGGGGGRG